MIQVSLLQHIKPDKGHSVLELFIAIIIFSLLMVLLMAVFDTGLKSWNTIEMKSDVQQKSLLSIDLLRKDLMFSDKSTLQIGGEGYEYIIMESAIGEDREFSFNHSNGSPQWQSYILYYTYPRSSAGDEFCLKVDLKSASPEKTPKKKLIRKVIKHNPSEVAKKLTTYQIYFTDSINPDPAEGIIGKPHILSKHIYNMDITENSVDENNGLDIKLTMVKSILEDRLAYVKDFSYNVGYETITLKGSVLLKNTKRQ